MKKQCPKCKREELVYTEFELVTIEKIFEFNEDGRINRDKHKKEVTGSRTLRELKCLNCGYKKDIR